MQSQHFSYPKNFCSFYFFGNSQLKIHRAVQLTTIAIVYQKAILLFGYTKILM